jgi:hypothetical protein
MLKRFMFVLAASAALAAGAYSSAAKADPIAGAIIGGGIGAAVGGPPGAAVGAVLGTAIGSARGVLPARARVLRGPGRGVPRARVCVRRAGRVLPRRALLPSPLVLGDWAPAFAGVTKPRRARGFLLSCRAPFGLR